MNVLILGGNGFLGPHVVQALENDHQLRITDIMPIDSPHDTREVDAANPDQVMSAAEGMDVIINCAVQRTHRKIAFGVNTIGTYNALRAAVAFKMKRFINTGPRFSLVGPPYLDYDHTITENIPPQPGTDLYAMSKALGLETCRLFAEQHPLHILPHIFSRFRNPTADPQNPDDSTLSISARDAGQAVKCALEVDLKTLPSNFEIFFITTDLPHNRFPNTRARTLLGFAPQDKLEPYWTKPNKEKT